VRVGALQADASPGLEAAVWDVLDRRLMRGGSRPIAVALSGGGDSLALLLAAEAWAGRAGRALIVLTVDHRLHPESAAWTEACAATAERLGLPFRALAWIGTKPPAGLPAAARRARHALLADAAREAGARVILMGHTADDVLEARLMRAAGSTTPDAHEWAPSPAWPEGRGVFVLRPLLGQRRAAIRDWLGARGERWIDDPANQNPAYARPRARQALARGAAAPEPPSTGASAAPLALACHAQPAGGLRVERVALRAAAPDALRRFLSAACLCAAGTDRPPARARVEALGSRVIGRDDFVATLAGARISAAATEVRVQREPGEVARGGLAPLGLAAGEAGVWDGRFEVRAAAAVEVRAHGRTTLPEAVDAAGNTQPLQTRSLVHERLLAACGAVEREPA